MAGLPGLAPMPRNRALLTLRAVNSVNTVLGAKIAASVTALKPASRIVAAVTAVTLAGTSFTSAGSFSAVTITVGSTMLGDWFVCANEAAGARAKSKRAMGRRMPDIMPVSRLPYIHAARVRCDGLLDGCACRGHRPKSQRISRHARSTSRHRLPRRDAARRRHDNATRSERRCGIVGVRWTTRLLARGPGQAECA